MQVHLATSADLPRLQTAFATEIAAAGDVQRWFATHGNGTIVAALAVRAHNPFEVVLCEIFGEGEAANGALEALLDRAEAFACENGYERVLLQGHEERWAVFGGLGFEPILDGPNSHPKARFRPVRHARTISHVAVVGGVHGNELLGIHLVRHVWKNSGSHPDLRRESVSVVRAFVANEGAEKACVRFVTRDLNRCFELTELDAAELAPGLAAAHPTSSSSTAPYDETLRAREINAFLGRKQHIPGSIAQWRKANPQAADYMIDLHSTTSNMGVSIITLAGDAFTIRTARQVMEVLRGAFPEIPVYLLVDEKCERAVNNNIDSLTPSGVCIEIGPLPHGTMSWPLFQAARRTCVEWMNCIHAFNTRGEGGGARHEAGGWVDGFSLWKPVYYPKSCSDEAGARHTVSACIHPSLLGKDYVVELHKGDAVFVDLETGDVIPYAEDASAYAVFISEAAYWTSGIAMWLCQKKTFAVYG